MLAGLQVSAAAWSNEQVPSAWGGSQSAWSSHSNQHHQSSPPAHMTTDFSDWASSDWGHPSSSQNAKSAIDFSMIPTEDSPERPRQALTRFSSQAHASSPASPPPQRELCKYFVHGGCARGADCPYSHDLTIEAPAGVDTSKGFILCENVANMKMSSPSKRPMGRTASMPMNIGAKEYIPQHHPAGQAGYHRDDVDATDVMGHDGGMYEGASYGEHADYGYGYSGEHGGYSGEDYDYHAMGDDHQHPAQRHLQPSFHRGPPYSGGYRESYEELQEQQEQEQAEDWGNYRRQQAMRPPLQSGGSKPASSTQSVSSEPPSPASLPATPTEPASEFEPLPKVSERRGAPPLSVDDRSPTPDDDRVAVPKSAMMHRMLRNGAVGPVAIGN